MHGARRAAMMLVLIFAADRSSAIDYFPTENGVALIYGHGVVEISSQGNSVLHLYTTLTFVSRWHYLIDESGDVLKVGGSEVGYPDWNENYISYSPPVVYLDFPLETGKTWSTTTLVEDTNGARYEMVFEGTVVGPASVTVPGGTFDVIVVRIDYRIPEEHSTGTAVLWLHQQIGQVMDLERWLGIVGTAGTTWGHLKSSFR